MRDIILIPFPFSDQSGMKKRPALILSNEKFNHSNDIIACAITSNKDSIFLIPIKPEDWKDGVYSESYVKTGNIITIDKDLVIKRIGRLSAERFNEVLSNVKELIG